MSTRGLAMLIVTKHGSMVSFTRFCHSTPLVRVQLGTAEPQSVSLKRTQAHTIAWQHCLQLTCRLSTSACAGCPQRPPAFGLADGWHPSHTYTLQAPPPRLLWCQRIPEPLRCRPQRYKSCHDAASGSISNEGVVLLRRQHFPICWYTCCCCVRDVGRQHSGACLEALARCKCCRSVRV
jgi:hypothetical protein